MTMLHSTARSSGDHVTRNQVGALPRGLRFGVQWHPSALFRYKASTSTLRRFNIYIDARRVSSVLAPSQSI